MSHFTLFYATPSPLCYSLKGTTYGVETTWLCGKVTAYKCHIISEEVEKVRKFFPTYVLTHVYT